LSDFDPMINTLKQNIMYIGTLIMYSFYELIKGAKQSKITLFINEKHNTFKRFKLSIV